MRIRHGIAALIAVAAAQGQDGPRISEFLASNRSGIRDADGERADWIEIVNAGPSPHSLEGWSLTDDPAVPEKWTFPVVTLPANGRLVVFASGKDRRAPGSELHTNFSLSAAGEYLALIAPDGRRASEFAPFPPQQPDVSWGEGAPVETIRLIRPDSPARFRVPDGPEFGDGWRGRTWDDSGWKPATAAIGYQLESESGEASAPLGWWPIEGDVADRTGNTDAVNNGAGFASEAAPVAGSTGSAAFDGSESFLSVPLDVSESAWTCSLWIRTTNPSTGIFCVVDTDLGENHDRHIYLTGGNIAARIWSDETIRSSGLNLADGRWHHVAHVFGGSTGGQRLYVDGAVVAQGSKASSNFDWQQRFHIGYSHDATRPFFEGLIDEVAVWNEALTPDQIAALAAGTPPPALAGLTPLIGTSVEGELRQVNASAALRIPFAAPGHDQPDFLSLRVHADDGFVAWLNGTEVARRNAPASPAWNATATADNPLTSVIAGEEIDLSAHRSLLLPEGNVLAVQALNDSADSPDFLLRVELSGRVEGDRAYRYFPEPSPGEPNGQGVAGFVGEVAFAPTRRYLDAPATITLTCATPGATIVFTTDGSVPSETNGTPVPAPAPDAVPVASVPVATTTNLRAIAVLPDHHPAPVVTHSYIFPSAVMTQPARPPGLPATWRGVSADYAMDPRVVNNTEPGYSVEDALRSLPSVVLTAEMGAFFDPNTGVYVRTDGRGIAWERQVSMEYFQPDGSSAFSAHAGVRIHGNSSRDHNFTPKHPLRLYFRNRYGTPSLVYPLFPGDGPQEFEHLLLRGCSTDSFPVVDGAPRWINDKATYLRDQFIRDTLADLGNISCRGIYVHLYLNNLYWGLYNLAERPVDSFNAAWRGGDKDEYDVMKDFAELESGTRAAWNAAMSAASNLASDEAYQRFFGNNPDGTRNPAYPVHLHLKSFIDYMIVHIAAGAEDWPDHNWWAARRRTPDSDGWYFFAWDQEISNDSLTRDRSHIFPAQPFESVRAPNSPAYLYDRLRRNPTFRRIFRDRVHELFFNGGPMTPEANRARWARRAAEIDRAIVAESARWGDVRDNPPILRGTKWLREQQWMQDPGGFWDRNHPRAIQRFRNVGLYPAIDAPTLLPPQGAVPDGTVVTIDSPHPVYYTLDGSDPMADSGDPAPGAIRYHAGFSTRELIPLGAEWRYLVDRTGPGPEWTAADFDDSAWPAGPAQLGYGDGDEATVIGYGPDIANRNITTWFRRTFEADGAVASLTLDLLRDDGAVVYLNGTEVARSNMPEGPVSPDTPATVNVDGDEETSTLVTFELPAALIRSGTNVVAVELHQVSAQSSDISFDARLTAQVQSDGNPIAVHGPATITARAFDGAEWSGRTIARYSTTSEGSDYNSWRERWFPASPPGSAPADDPDSDGIPNLLEFVLDSPPLAANPSGIDVTSGRTADGSPDGTVTLTFRRRESHPGVTLTPESSPDAATWSPATPLRRELTPDGPGMVLESLTIPAPSPRLLLRLRAAMQ